MKREFLKELGLEDTIIDKIMAENGKDIEKHKVLVEKEKQVSEKLKEELEGVKVQLVDANTQIEEFKGMDIESIKKSADEWKTKYETETQALIDNLAKKDYEYAVSEYLNNFDFVSDFTKKAFMQEFILQDFKLENGKFLGGDDFIKDFQKNNVGVFKEEVEQAPQENPYIYTPQDENKSSNTTFGFNFTPIKNN